MKETESRYLIFSLGGELYGSPILGVREVLEPQPIKPVPNGVSYFAGVINVRGEIVGVIDLRARFDYPRAPSPTLAYVIFESAVGPLGAIVDQVLAVAELPEESIERKPPLAAEVSADFLLGIGRHGGRLVSLVDFNRILGAEDLGNLRRARLG